MRPTPRWPSRAIRGCSGRSLSCAGAAEFTYQSSIASFRGQEICTRDPWVNGKSWSIADGYHPSRSGYANGLAPAVREVIG